MTLTAAVLFSAAGREATESFEAQQRAMPCCAPCSSSNRGRQPRPGSAVASSWHGPSKNIAHDGELRKALLEGLREGVVLWNPTGQPVLANRSTLELWDRAPSMTS